MKVLFYIRQNHNQVKGGDLVQLYSTANALEAKGVKVDFSSDPKLNLKAYDLVHIFNSPRFEETVRFAKNAKRQNIPLAFSTIYWSKDELAVGIANSTKVRLVRSILGVSITKTIWKLTKRQELKSQKPNIYELERWLFANSDILLPNSHGEMREIEKNFGLKNLPYHPVRNAINAKSFTKQPSKERSPYVLSVGRVENRKNTLKLIEACINLGYSLVLIGGYDPNDSYGKRCLALAKKHGFTHIPNLDQKELLPYFYEAKVHAMVSWYETPGLATMEAACGGCSIATTDRGSTREYFENLVNYCDPFSKKSIENALQKAMTSPSNFGLRSKILSEYTWDKAADDTLEGYRELLS